MKVTLIIASVLLLLASGNAQSICTKYSTALNINNSALVTGLVLATFGNITAPASPLLHFFDGTIINFPGNMMIDFRVAGAPQATLVQHLVQFFGAALGCADGSIGTYAGATMPASHMFMNISNSQFNYFKAALGGVGAGNGVQPADLTAVNTVLETTRSGVCNQPDCSTICNRYSGALGVSNYGLVSTVVSGVFANVSSAGSPLLHFFDGTTVNFPGNMMIDFRVAGTSQTTLVAHLIQFFGAALGCDDGTIGTYAGATMSASHSFMTINNANFNYFNQVVLGVMGGAGVTPADQTAVLGVLETTRVSICNQADCVAMTSAPATSANPTTKAAGSLFAPMIALLAALLALAL